MKIPASKNKRYARWRKLFALAFIIVIAQCIGIGGLEQPTSGIAGEEVTIMFRPKISPHPNAGMESNVRLVVGFLAPKSWNAGANTTMTYSSNMGNGRLVRVPPGRTPQESTREWSVAMMEKAGIGANLIKDLEWIAFWTEQTYNMGGGGPVVDVNVAIKTILGPQNMKVQLGYFTASTTLNINTASNWAAVFGEPFEVTDGEGPMVDFTSPQLAEVNPLKNTDNDLITITFDGSIIPTDLDNANEVYLCATGYTKDNMAFEVCARTDKSRMRSLGDKRWQVDLWPRNYFGVPEDQVLQRMEYSFTDAAGTHTVVDEGSGEPFKFLFGCD